MSVSKLGASLSKGMTEIVDEFKERVHQGEVLSFTLITEVLGERRPIVVVRGGFQRDMYSALVALDRAKHLVQRHLDRSEFMDLR